MTCTDRLFEPDNHAADRPEWIEVSEQQAGSVLRLVRAHYDLDLEPAVEVRCAAGPNVNSMNFKAGSFLIKQVSYPEREEFHVFLPRLSAHLSSSGVPSVSLCRNRRGEPVTEVSASRAGVRDFLIVQPFLEGMFFSGGERQLVAAIATWQRMETVMPLLDSSGLHRERFKDWTPGNLLREGHAALSGAACDHSRCLYQNLQPFYEELLAIAADFEAAPHEFQSRSLRHFDLHPHNLLFEGDRLLAILDLDSFLQIPASTSLALMLYKLGRKALACRQMSLAEFRAVLPDCMSRVVLRRAVRVELLRRICTILQLHVREQDRRWDQDLVKHLRGLRETDQLFG